MGERKRLLALVAVAVIYSAVYLGMQHNLAMKTAALAERPITIVVDAGHGGEDSGTVSGAGTRESDVNLAVALRLEQVLALCGMKPAMIRRDDSSVFTDGDSIQQRKVSDLKQRVRFVEQQTPAILVSIHQNHFDQSKYKGAQVFYGSVTGSKDLAQLTQSLLRQALDPENNREIKRADTVYLMEKIDCPGILVECGFLSNPNEALRLQEPVYQTKIACAISSALAQFLEEGNDLEV